MVIQLCSHPAVNTDDIIGETGGACSSHPGRRPRGCRAAADRGFNVSHRGSEIDFNVDFNDTHCGSVIGGVSLAFEDGDFVDLRVVRDLDNVSLCEGRKVAERHFEDGFGVVDGEKVCALGLDFDEFSGGKAGAFEV